MPTGLLGSPLSLPGLVVPAYVPAVTTAVAPRHRGGPVADYWRERPKRKTRLPVAAILALVLADEDWL